MADTDDPYSIPVLDSDWPAQAADTIEQVVTAVRQRVVAPILLAARVIVYVVVSGTLILAAVLMLIIALIRALDNYLPGGVWVAYLVLGGVFVIAGLIVWTKRGTATLPDPIPTPITPVPTS